MKVRLLRHNVDASDYSYGYGYGYGYNDNSYSFELKLKSTGRNYVFKMNDNIIKPKKTYSVYNERLKNAYPEKTHIFYDLKSTDYDENKALSN